MVNYSSTSPYANTATFSNFLDILKFRPIKAERDDVIYQIQKVYEHRPDLLAHDIYKDASLWWVFAVRNMSRLKDPIYDFKTGRKIFIPKLTNIQESLGIE